MSGGKQESEATWTMLLIVGVVSMFLWLLWHFFRGQVLEVMRWIRLAEIGPISIFDSGYRPCVSWLLHAHVNDVRPSADMIGWTNSCFGVNFLQHVPSADVPFYYQLSAIPMATIEQGVTYYYHYPLALIFAFFAYHMFFVSPRGKFKTRHTLETFIKTQAKMWPVISPIVDFDPIKSSARILGGLVPDKLPIFAEALSPEEWISWNRITVTNNIPDREATRRAFVQQLGPRWNGIESAPAHMQALYAAYALKGTQKREESDDFLGDIALCWSEKGDFKPTSDLMSRVKKIINDPELGGKAAAVASAHAYRTTAMLAVLKWARSMGGVLAPAQFLWLRGTDRALWYPLNNLGRRSYHSEGAGAMAHFMAELNAKKPLPIPRVDTAIITLNQYMATTGHPIPPREGDKEQSPA